MSDKDKRIEKLEEKVEQLENAVRMPTRREALIGGGIAAAGIAGFGGGTAAASPTDAEGTVYFQQIGDETYPVDSFYVDKEYQAADDQNPIFDSVTTDGLRSRRSLHSSDFNTLQDAIDEAASNNIRVVYVTEDYPNENVTISSPMRVVGDCPFGGVGRETGDVTLNADGAVAANLLVEGDVIASANRTHVFGIQATGQFRAQSNRVMFTNLTNAEVVFETGTEQGIADTIMGGGSSVTDNGNNRVGDIF